MKWQCVLVVNLCCLTGNLYEQCYVLSFFIFSLSFWEVPLVCFGSPVILVSVFISGNWQFVYSGLFRAPRDMVFIYLKRPICTLSLVTLFFSFLLCLVYFCFKIAWAIPCICEFKLLWIHRTILSRGSGVSLSIEYRLLLPVCAGGWWT